MKTKFYLFSTAFILLALFSGSLSLKAQDCKVTRNFFEGDGGSSSGFTAKGSNGGKTIFVSTGFEDVTLKLGSIPTSSAEYRIVNYTSTPGSDEISVKIYAPGGNEVDTYEFADDGKTALVCNQNGQITVSWQKVVFKQTANSKLPLKTSCEITCGGPPSNQTTTSTNGGNNVTTTSNSSSSTSTNINANNGSTTATPPPVDPDAQLKADIANYDKQLADYTKTITAKEFELNDKKSKNQIDSVDAVIAKYDIEILKSKRDETKYALERSNKTLSKELSIDNKQDYIAKEEQARLKAKSIESDRNALADLKNQNTASNNAINDLNNLIITKENDIKTASPKNALDSLRLSVKQIEVERHRSEIDKNKLIADRTSKALKGKLNEKLAQDFKTKEDACQQKINDCNNRIAEKDKLIKVEAKKEKKENNKAKVDGVKAKIRIPMVKKSIASKEKDLEKYQKKNKVEKIEATQKELDELRKELAELEAAAANLKK